MANDIVRPSALPVRTNPVPSEVVPSDNQVSVAGVSWEDGVNSAVPPASQAEAEAGVINSKRMTPLTTKQAIDAQVPSKISTAINSLNLGTMSQETAADYTPTAGLAAVALSNEYGDLDNLPTLGTAAATDAADYATAAQGGKADTALQPSDIGTTVQGHDGFLDALAGMIPGSNGQVIAFDASGNPEAVTVSAASAVSYAPQVLSSSEQGQARDNIGAGILSGFRNKIINGDFDVNQRGTSIAVADEYPADRWQARAAISSIATSQQAFTVGQTDVPGNPSYFVRCVATTGGTDVTYALLSQPIEDVKKLSGKTVTVTFWAKSDAAQNIAVDFEQRFGAGGSAHVLGAGVTGAIPTSTTWTKITRTVSIPSVAGKTLGTGSSLLFNIWFEGGSDHDLRTGGIGNQSGTFDIAHVSIVEGDATAEDDPFSPRHIQQELSLCQRYFRIYASSQNVADLAYFMRTTPTASGAGPYIYDAEL